MFNSQILDVAIGLAMMFFFQSILVSGLNEALVSLLATRGKALKNHLILVMGCSKNDTKSFFIHFAKSPFISSLRKAGSFPSYISCANFSDAIIETLTREDLEFVGLSEKIRQNINMIPDSDFKKVVKHKFEEANGNIQVFKTSMENWFTDYMDRVSAWYRRKTKMFIYIFSFFITIFLNVDAFRVMNELWKNSKVRESVVSLAQNVASDQLKSLTVEEGTDTLQAAISKIQTGFQNLRILDYPITWEYEFAIKTGDNGSKLKTLGILDRLTWTFQQINLEKLLGFIITTLASSIGAPIWYDMIKKLLDLRQPSAKC